MREEAVALVGHPTEVAARAAEADLRRVVSDKDRPRLYRSRDRALDVRREDAVGCDALVAEESIRRLEFRIAVSCVGEAPPGCV